MENIEIEWEGPFQVNEFVNNIPIESENTGVYLWCSKLEDKVFCVNYIGSAPVYNISDRIRQEHNNCAMYSQIDYSHFNNENNLEKKEINIVNNVWESFSKELIESNKENSYIFFILLMKIKKNQ